MSLVPAMPLGQPGSGERAHQGSRSTHHLALVVVLRAVAWALELVLGLHTQRPVVAYRIFIDETQEA